MEQSRIPDTLTQREQDEAYLHVADHFMLMTKAKEQCIQSLMGKPAYEIAKNWQYLDGVMQTIVEQSNDVAQDELDSLESKAFIDFMENLFTQQTDNDSLSAVREKAEEYIEIAYPNESLASLWKAFCDTQDSRAQEIAIRMFNYFRKPQEQVFYETILEDMNSHFLTKYYRQTVGLNTIVSMYVTDDSLSIELSQTPSPESIKFGRPGFENDAYIELIDGEIILNDEPVIQRDQLYSVLDIVSTLPNIITQIEREFPE